MKKFLPVDLVILAVLAIGGGLMAMNFKKSLPIVSPIGLAPTPAAEAKLLTWEDPAGFKFDYPAEIKIDSHPEDKVNYANLDLTNPDYPGGIKILMTDSRPVTKPTPSLETELGGKPAKKEIFSSPAKIIVLAQDGNAMVAVEVNLEGNQDYWQRIYNDLLSSFEFIPLAKSGSSGPPAGGGVVEEEEEIIE